MPRRRDNAIPLLVTLDLEIAPDHDLAEQKSILHVLHTDFKRLGLPITVFCTSEAAGVFDQEIRMLRTAGHEIACHGVSHGADFGKLSLHDCRDAIARSTACLREASGTPPRCFRGPGMTTSAITQRVLVEHGYEADFSVCSQRIDVLNSKGGCLGWLTAPRRPYRPSEDSPFRKGDVPLLVVPLSCLGVPFLSGLLYLWGAGFMMAFFEILLDEARRIQKPIVYLFHSYEFSAYRGTARTEDGANTAAAAAKRKFLHSLYLRDRKRRYEVTRTLFEHMLSKARVRPMTGREYVQQFHDFV
jgi:hypothetical protein